LAANLREKQAGRKAAAAKKRKRPEDDDGDKDEVETRPRKTRKGVTRKQPKSGPPTHSIAANRARRIIQPTEKAKAAQEQSDVEEDTPSSCSDESDDGYIDSDDDYSD
jgi:hypothetical protein